MLLTVQVPPFPRINKTRKSMNFIKFTHYTNTLNPPPLPHFLSFRVILRHATFAVLDGRRWNTVHVNKPSCLMKNSPRSLHLDVLLISYTTNRLHFYTLVFSFPPYHRNTTRYSYLFQSSLYHAKFVLDLYTNTLVAGNFLDRCLELFDLLNEE